MAADVMIIGAGPAGSAVALLLARRGWSVTLVEQHKFPRDKVCGECLSADGIEALGRMGLAGELERLNPIQFTHAEIHSSDGASARIPLSRPMWGISRLVFDQFLLEAARQAGVTILQPARCEAINFDPPIGVRIRMMTTNVVEECHPSHLILADGKSAFPTPPPRTNDFGVKTHFVDVDGPRDAIELFGCNSLYGGLAAIEGDRWNAAFSVPGTRLRRHRGNTESLFAEIVAENPVLARRLKMARRVSNWLAAPLPRFAVRRSSGAWAVGNAAAAIEPIGGEGMGLALASAVLTADAFGKPGDSTSTPGVLTSTYRRLWNRRRTVCRAAAMAVSRPRLASAIIPGLDLISTAAAMALRWMGK